MEQNKYWQSFGELNESSAYKSAVEDEFQEDLPVEADDKGLLDAKTPRRDFLKFLGFSTAAATVAASCEMPVKKAIPFVNKPEDIIPGVANYYATTFVSDGEAVAALAKVRDGRPIKIEGNELSPITLGGTSPRMQASVLDLYDTSRLPFPIANGKEVSTFETLDRMVAADLANLGGKPVVLLTSSISSPTTNQVITQFLAKFPGSRHVMYDAVSYSGMLLANQATYGTRAIPAYNLAAAKVIVSINADFLSSWLNPVEFNRQYSLGRKLNKRKPDMSRHIQFESLMSMTGANADERYHHRPSESGAIALALYAALGGAAAAPALDPNLQKAIQKTAATLTKNRGAAVVLAGSNDPNIQIVVNGINELIGANGATIDWSSTNNTRQAIDADFNALVNDMNAGAVGALLIHEANPAYNSTNRQAFIDGLKKVKLTVSFNSKIDETSEFCKYVIPDHHYLESWGDAEVRTGFVSLIQPTINPLFKTRHWQDSLLKWSSAPTDFATFHRQYWVGRLGSEANWDKALQDGVIKGGTSVNMVLTNPTSNAPDTGRSTNETTLQDLAAHSGGKGATYNGAPLSAAMAAVGSAKKGGNAELVLYQKVTVGSGQQASNPWLHEAPDPITKATWDNYAVISPAMAKSIFGIDLEDRGQTDDYEVHPEKPVMKVSVNGKNIELPIIIVPGTNPNTVGIALGYGRGVDGATTDDDASTRKDQIEKARNQIGKAGGAVGKNAYPFVSFNGVTRDYFIPSAEVSKAGYNYRVAQNQTHQTYEGRTEVVLETTLATLRKEPKMFSERREELHKDFAPKAGENYERDATLYPLFPKPGIKWGMSIDLNSCTGCQACVVACHIENNVPIVGKEEVARYHDMFWLRIDRYFSGNMENPSVVFQPMLCQHCDNAPCENVCPVAATMHSSEGLNMMAYNRCIGTRYCANNCPYKVRRFNWADYQGADSFPDNQKGIISDVTMMMNDDLTRMVLNPDVTVRSRGVMEKCTFCVQRCQDGKLKAKKESRPLKTGENGEFDVKTACQQACPTDAIVFGNVNDKQSQVYQHRADNQDRMFYALEMLHSLPNVSYLAKVRNNDAIVHLSDEDVQETTGAHQSKGEEKVEGVR